MRNIPVHHRGFEHEKLRDLLKKHKGGMHSDQTLKDIWRHVNEEFDINEKYVAKFSDGKGDVEVDAKQSAHDINKKLRKKVGDRMKYFTGYKKVNESVNEDQEKNPANFQHLCAKQVTHESWGEGETVYSMHAEPDEAGNIEWDDVMFEHGIEKQVPITELKVLTSANHNNAHKMGKGKKSLKSAHCSEFEPQGNQVNEENVALFKKRYMYSKKADAEKKAKEIGGKVEKSKAAHFQGYYAVKEETELEEGAVKDFLMDVDADAGDMSLNDLIKKYYKQMGLSVQDIKRIYYRVNEEKEVKDNPTLQESIMDVWSKGAEQQEKIESEAKWLKTEEEEKKSLNEEKIKCPNCGHMNDAGADKCANCGYDLSKKEGKHDKKKAMTGSPSTKVDVKPEVDFDGK